MNHQPSQSASRDGRGPLAVELPIVSSGPILWRDLNERAAALGDGAGAPERAPGPYDYDALLARSDELRDDLPGRREFLRLMAASMALAGGAAATGCAVQPSTTIVPYVEAPEELVPGKPLFFSTALVLDGAAIGVLAESHMGRPTKIEGNPDHPASLGATDAFAQAEILSFYDPDRSRVVTREGRVDTWEHVQSALLDVREACRADKGAGLRLLTPAVASPTLADQIGRLLKEFPEARWHAYQPVARGPAAAGRKRAFGEAVDAVYHVGEADVIVALDADFMGWGPGRLRDARAFAGRREPDPAARAYIHGNAKDAKDAPAFSAMNRLYAIECTPTITGASADHRFPVAARDVVSVARAIAGAFGVGQDGAAEPATAESVAKHLPEGLRPRAGDIAALARDLKKAGARGLVVPGEAQPAEVHALAHWINHKLGATGRTVDYVAAAEAGPVDHFASIAELAADINAQKVDTLIVLGGNPAYDAPAELGFGDLLISGKITRTVHLGPYHDETARLCYWHVPEAHALESWGDARAFDGSAAIQQPLIAPLYGGKSAIEVMAQLLGEPGRDGMAIVRDYWRRALPAPENFDSVWREALRKGAVPGTALKPKTVQPDQAELKKAMAAAPASALGGLELVFRPDPAVWDGRYANNAWLQELPRPLTRLTWDNAALVSPVLAERLKLETGDVVSLGLGGKSVELPAYVMPGQAEETVTVTLGYGRAHAGRVGTGVGVDVYPLRTAAAPWRASGLAVAKAGRSARLATTQHHHRMEGRELVRGADWQDYQADPDFAQIHEQDRERGPSLIDEHEPAAQKAHEEGAGNAWGMVVNLNACIGCGACVTACQAENNIPVVGRDEVLASREMHWIRVDRYFEGEATENPPVDFQPVACVHCEKAPCEIVCPVGATTHSAEGLNEMTYNRCVGTRYCSNNCPYKVRRFNFFQYSDEETPGLKLMRNPEVTVRPRGVMEKCTYCVQRINRARIEAEIAGRPVGGDEVVTACQGACPTRAIIFGNLNDADSTVTRVKASPRDYGLLAELNTRPRTTYLARLRNPNPEIEATSSDAPQRP